MRSQVQYAALTLLLLPAAVPAQQVTLAGLRAQNGVGAFHGVKQDAAGNLYTLFDAHDGVRLLKFDATATQLLGQVKMGSAGDTGVALDLDVTGNVYVAGTSTSLGSVSGTGGTAFPARADSSTNSFVARFSPALAEQWLSFCGGGTMAVTGIAATSSSVMVTGSIFAATLPVTSGGVQQAPAVGSNANGFVESFAGTAGTLQYATYLTGYGGDTLATAIAVDASGNAYVAGSTTSTGYPTTAALIPVFRAVGSETASGFLTKLDAAGDGFLFSTFVPGGGLISVAADASGSGSLLVSGNVSSGLFPVTNVQAPVVSALSYQAVVRLALDGSGVLSSTLLAPAAESFVAAGQQRVAWVFADGTGVPPLSPLVPVETMGSSFAVRVGASGDVDRVVRFGGLPASNSAYASLPVVAGGVTVSASGVPSVVGSVSPTLSSSLLSTEQYDLPLVLAPNGALPSTVRDALPSAACGGSACSGSAGLLAQLAPDALLPGLALSVDALPNLTLSNLGTAAATGLQLSSSGYGVSSDCGSLLAAGAACSVIVSGSGPGSVSISATNASSFTTTLPVVTAALNSIAVVPREIDFGIQTSASSPDMRTLTLTNLGSTTQTFVSKSASTATTGYSLVEAGSTCTAAAGGGSKVLAAGASCTITLQLTAGASASTDGSVNALWTVGSSDVLVTGYAQAASLSLSASVVDFDRQYPGGLRTQRFLYLSNSSDVAQTHAEVRSVNAAFSVTDECSATLQPRSVCRIAMAYEAATASSSDAMTLSVDGLTATVLGETLALPSIGSASVNPNLTVSKTSVSFATAVTVTTASSETHTVSIGNTGASAFALALGLTGDFASTTSCPATLGGGTSCMVTLSFTPSAAGERQGLLSIVAGSSAPVYVELAGIGTAILPPTSDALDFGGVPLDTPAVQWHKVSQPFPSFTATSTDGDYTVLLVEDNGYGHGEPASSVFSGSVTGTCFNCYLGIQFLPAVTGVHAATILLSSPGAGQAEVIAVTGYGTALSGPILTPAAEDFGTVAVGSSSDAMLLQLNNGSAVSLTINGVSVTGDFARTSTVTGGVACAGASVAPGASCFVPVNFAPTLSGTRTGVISIATSAGTVMSALTGTGSVGSGVAFSPASVSFGNVPGAGAALQSVTLTNLGSSTAMVGTPAVSDSHFAVASSCSTLAVGASCTLGVSYAASAATASGVLSVPVTTSPAGAASTATYAVPLSGLYTSENAGLQIIPGEDAAVQFGSAATGAAASTRVLHVNNVSGVALTLTVEAPRQFAVTGSTCAGLAANASCDLTVTYTPLTGGDTTGTVFLQGQPADGSATRDGLGYLQGFGVGNGALQITGNISPLGVLSFGEVTSGQLASQIVTLTNPVTAVSSVTVRRVQSEFPFVSTTTCGAALAPGQSCAVTVVYTPLFQATAVAAPTSDTGTLTIESDAANAPVFVDLGGLANPAVVTTPVNTAPLASYTISQGSLTFPVTPVGTASATQSITLSNTGTQTLHVLGLVTTSSFSVAGNCTTLLVGEACVVAVSFHPQAAGATLAALEIQTDSSDSLEFVSLYGTAGAASVTLTPASIDFGRVLVGTSGSQFATLTNTGSAAVTYTGASIVGSGFAVAGSSSAAQPCISGLVLAAGASCTVAVTFTPGSVGSFYGALSVTTSATALPLSVDLSGTGTQPQLVVTPAALAFGTVLVGSSSTLPVTVQNTSTLPVDGLAFSVTSGFSVSTTCGLTTIRAGSSCSVSVTFAPVGGGATTGMLTIASTDPASPIVVPLTGVGLQAGSFLLTVNGASAASVTVRAGLPAVYALVLTPVNGYAGAVALTCTADTPVVNAACSLVPPLVTLGSGAQSSTATITTVSAVTTASEGSSMPGRLALAMLPVLLAVGRRRRRGGGLLVLLGLVLIGGCGGDRSRILYVAPGMYTFHVTATSTYGVPVSQSVTLTMVVVPRS